MSSKVLLSSALLIFVLALSGCKTSQERAEQHYQNALRLLEAGDFDRANVEFRNVFDLDGEHRAARGDYAEALRDKGDLQQSYAQYLRLIEQYNDDVPARLSLAEMALLRGDEAETSRHLEAGLKAEPENNDLKAVAAALSYARAQQDKDDTKRLAAVADARKLVDALPENTILRRILIDDAMRSGTPEQALDVIDAAIEVSSDEVGFYRQRLSILNQLNREDEVTVQLRDMVDRFPEDIDMKRALLAWYIDREEFDDAEGVLREIIVDKPAEDTPRLDLITFLARYKSGQVALDEIGQMIAADPENAMLRAAQADLNFQSGRQDQAITDLRNLVPDMQPGRTLDHIKLVLAGMLVGTGNDVGARALVDDILISDSSNVEALKLKAGWLVENDETDAAIIALRTALDQDPRDAEAMTLMAQAYERVGNTDLVGEMLARSVEASGKGVDQSVRYAAFLRGQDQPAPAEQILIDALQLAPSQPALLLELGRVYIATRDWDKARNVVSGLQSIEGNPAIEQAAASLEASIIAGEDGLDDSIDFLNDLVNQGVGGVRAQAAIVRTHIQRGDLDAAQSYIASAIEKQPDEPLLQFIQASVRALNGDVKKAEDSYRALTENVPEFALAWRALYVQLVRESRTDEASEVLSAGLAANPNDRDLRWAKAGALERDGQPKDALAIFQSLYDEDSNSPIVANNLASLLAETSDDPEDLERALRIARRLRGSSFAPFQDTYGWIAYRTGDYDAARQYLEPAAEQMQASALVQYHLGMTYSKLRRPEDAKTYLQKAVDLAGEDDVSAPIVQAREELTRLSR